ncbi:interferon regulatory factor 1 isoform X2 [Pseudophryne corroboree]|uniref:interferon regulatory factor 1 isoform X2 n=1 Tax=Pseudophryne corroboree TaxID=495146 RepID=UPI003081A0A0
MPVTRLRMRPWLEKQIASNTIPGLSWLNKEEMIFQIPWKHAARHGWNIDKDACLFRSWAIHTGKFKLGEKEPDPKTWKANFRCAMNSLPDIKEVKNKSIYKGSSAVRVYQMLPAQVKLEKKERKSKSSKISKDRTKSKADGSFTEEVEEAVKHCQQPDDHSDYTTRLFSAQEIDIASTDIIAMSECEVSSSISDWKDTMDMPMPDSTSDMYPFQVSPMTSGSEEDEDMLTINEELLNILAPVTITEWQQINVDGKGYYTNDSAAPSTLLQDLSSMLDDMSSVSGDIEVRVTTDMRPAIESSWHEMHSITCTL